VIGVVLTQDWLYYWLRGTSEVVLIGASLWAIDAARRHKTQAFLLGVAAALIRPEWWPFVGLYAVWLWFREPQFAGAKMRLLIVAGFALDSVFVVRAALGGLGQPFLAAPTRRVQRPTSAPTPSGGDRQGNQRTGASGADRRVVAVAIGCGVIATGCCWPWAWRSPPGGWWWSP